MVLRTATTDENVQRPRTLIMVAARDRGRATLGSRTRPQRSPGKGAIRRVGRDQADEKRPNGNLTPGQVDWTGGSVDVDRSQRPANESADPLPQSDRILRRPSPRPAGLALGKSNPLPIASSGL
jgi:hypothetical protein